MKGKAKRIYNRALRNGVTAEATCVGITQSQWDRLMNGATRANKNIVTRILKDVDGFDKDLLRYYNPYNHYKTETHIIYVHSSIEHFFRIN